MDTPDPKVLAALIPSNVADGNINISMRINGPAGSFPPLGGPLGGPPIGFPVVDDVTRICLDKATRAGKEAEFVNARGLYGRWCSSMEAASVLALCLVGIDSSAEEMILILLEQTGAIPTPQTYGAGWSPIDQLHSRIGQLEHKIDKLMERLEPQISSGRIW